MPPRYLYKEWTWLLPPSPTEKHKNEREIRGERRQANKNKVGRTNKKEVVLKIVAQDNKPWVELFFVFLMK